MFPKQNTGDEYVIFCSLFTLKQWESDTDAFLTAIDPIIKGTHLSDILSSNLAQRLKVLHNKSAFFSQFERNKFFESK